METFWQSLQEYIDIIFSPYNLNRLTKIILRKTQELQEFKFQLDNPIFWLIMLFTLLILSRKWGTKKAFSYCMVVGTVLYLSSIAVTRMNISIQQSNFTYSTLLKIFTFFLLTLITLYYLFIKNGS
jgi:hypothetical protein